MYFVGAVIITIKCNNEFTGLFHNIDFGQKKIVLIKRIFFYQSCIKSISAGLLRIKQSQTNDALMTLLSLNMTSSEQIT